MKLLRAAKVIILDRDDNALVLRRSETHPRSPQHPDLPGGIIEDGETFEDGVTREIKEETGLDIAAASLTLIYTLTHDFFGKPVSRLIYAVRLDGERPSIKLSWEHNESHWEPVSEITSMERPYQQGIDYANEHHLWAEI